MLAVVMLSVFNLYAGCRYAECLYAECRYAECRGAGSILVIRALYHLKMMLKNRLRMARAIMQGILQGGSITVLLTSCLTALD